jgi:cyclohexanone monooxygenase
MSCSKEASRRVNQIQQHLTAAAEPDLPFDPAEVNARYAHERDIRLNKRPEGTGQYVHIDELASRDSRFAAMLSDPWSEVPERAPKMDEVEIAIIGAGYGGLCAGARLVMEGVPSANIRVVDSASNVGGTWYWNRYPGAMCDVESYTYMPLLEELGYIPSEKYAHAPELMAHSQMIAEKWGLYENALFNTKCTGMTWDEGAQLWTITSNRGDAFKAKYVFMNFGTLTRPKLPGAPGVESFKGHMMHTSRWDFSYTGGDSLGGLSKLGDKRVAIIGTGATAVQAVPHLGEHAKELYVFQRTPSSVDVRNNRKTTPEFIAESLSKPGWQKVGQRLQVNTLLSLSTLGSQCMSGVARLRGND